MCGVRSFFVVSQDTLFVGCGFLGSCMRERERERERERQHAPCCSARVSIHRLSLVVFLLADTELGTDLKNNTVTSAAGGPALEQPCTESDHVR